MDFVSDKFMKLDICMLIELLPGCPIGISNAYSNRFACAVDPSNSFDTRRAETVSIDVRLHSFKAVRISQFFSYSLLPCLFSVLFHFQVSIYECESTGGTQWIQEDMVSLKNIKIPRNVFVPVDASHSIHSPVVEKNLL